MPSAASAIRSLTLADRAKELCHDVASEYRYIKSTLKPDQTINLSCTVGGVEYDVYSLGGRNGVVRIDTQIEGAVVLIRCPVEQVSFFITISKKTSDKPPREIGFHAIGEIEQKEA